MAFSICLRLNSLSFFQVNKNFISRICTVRHFSESKDDGIPQPPKKPTSTFIQFFISKKDEIMSNNPGVRVSELTKVASKMWKELDEKKKQEFQKDYDQRKSDYNEAYSNFLSSLTEEQQKQFEENNKEKLQKHKERKARRKYLKRIADLGKPKAAVSGYSYFAKEILSQRKDVKILDAIKEVSRKWRELSEEKKEKYNQEAAVDRARYEEEMSVWVQQMVLDGNDDVITKKQIKRELLNLGQPKQPGTVFTMFTNDHAGEKGDKSIGEFIKEMGKKWSKLPNKEKQVYADEYLEKKENYKQAMHDWETQIEEDGMTEFVVAARKMLKPKRKVVAKPKKKTKKTRKAKKKTTKKSKDEEGKSEDKTTKTTKSKKSTEKEKTEKSEKKETKPKKSKEKKSKETKSEETKEWYEE